MHAGHLLPEWLGIVWAAGFLMIAAAHVAHLRAETGQRRPWHACHVLMAVGMAAMYVPARLDPLTVPAGLWQAIFAVAGLIAAGWAITGAGRVSTVVWLGTAGDLAAMLYMWSHRSTPASAPVAWLACGYLVVIALVWALDLYRRVEHAAPIVDWRLFLIETAGGDQTARTAPAGTLLGDRDISASMIVMTLGMAYMLIAMTA